jgi:DNA polymerase III epsilon subunit-like protein
MSISPRLSAIQIARQMLTFQPVYLDTETTGLEKSSEIIEIGIIDDTAQVLFESLVRPTAKIPSDAMRIHGITNDMVKDAPAWFHVWPKVEAVLAGRQVGIYNSEFDLRLIQQTHVRYHIRWELNATTPFCIMKLYAQFYGQWNRAYGNYRYFSLETARQQCNIPLPNSHRALDDALLARAVLHHIADSN